MKTIFSKHNKILFQGDSITDAGRNRWDNNDLGTGYAMMAAAWLSALLPKLKLKFFNRGISGNTTNDLLKRWMVDCIALQPDWISIMIGVNNCWQHVSGMIDNDADQFEKEYRQLLQRVKNETDAKLIICEPFLLSVSSQLKQFYTDLERRIEKVQLLAEEFDAVIIPLDKVFQEAEKIQKPKYWAEDGVHPTLAGHALIAQKWIEGAGE